MLFSLAHLLSLLLFFFFFCNKLFFYHCIKFVRMTIFIVSFRFHAICHQSWQEQLYFSTMIKSISFEGDKHIQLIFKKSLFWAVKCQEKVFGPQISPFSHFFFFLATYTTICFFDFWMLNFSLSFRLVKNIFCSIKNT